MRCRHGLSPDRTASYPLLGVRKPAPTIAGDRRARSNAPGVSSGGGGGARRVHAAPARAPPTSFACIFASQLPTPPGFPAPWPQPWTGAKDHRRRLSPGGHGGAPPNRGTPPPYAPLCPSGAHTERTARPTSRPVGKTNNQHITNTNTRIDHLPRPHLRLRT